MSCRGMITRIKTNIINSNGKYFDGDGYPFKKALSELRKEGVIILYDRKEYMYFVKQLRAEGKAS
jgi:hypothetical protein